MAPLLHAVETAIATGLPSRPQFAGVPTLPIPQAFLPRLANRSPLPPLAIIAPLLVMALAFPVGWNILLEIPIRPTPALPLCRSLNRVFPSPLPRLIVRIPLTLKPKAQAQAPLLPAALALPEVGLPSHLTPVLPRPLAELILVLPPRAVEHLMATVPLVLPRRRPPKPTTPILRVAPLALELAAHAVAQLRLPASAALLTPMAGVNALFLVALPRARFPDRALANPKAQLPAHLATLGMAEVSPKLMALLTLMSPRPPLLALPPMAPRTAGQASPRLRLMVASPSIPSRTVLALCPLSALAELVPGSMRQELQVRLANAVAHPLLMVTPVVSLAPTARLARAPV